MTEAQESVGDLVASEIQEAQAINNGTCDQRLDHLRRAQELIIHHDPSGSLLDNFLDEMLEFMIDSDAKIRCFVVGFILEACKKEMELIKKMGSNLLFMLSDQSQNVSVTKKVINVATLLYPLLLSWMSKQKNPDQETELAWENFAVLKGRVLHQIESENEGIRTQTFKFLESCILAQTPKTAQSEGSKADSMSLDQVPRDHRFISYRKLDLEAKQYIDSLLQQLSAAHISSLNLLTVISCLTNIARQRPEYMEKVLLAFETLHVNLPPTLGTSQVKSVRKELKMHLLRLLKHEASSPFHPQITTLLTDLGASQQEVLRALPSDSELKRRMRRPGESADAGAPQRKRAKPEEASTSQVVVEADDDQEDDDASAADSETKRTQSAIDITGQYLYDKLTAKNVADLVLVSMTMLPDEMPPNFQSSYTPIAAAGTEAQIRHLSRMMATQFTAQGVGPGVEQGKREAREKYLERQSAKMEGAVMPPTPAHISASSGESSMAPPPPPPAKPPGQPLYGVQGQQKASKRLIQFGLAHITRPMQPEERSRMIQFAFEHIINSEKRALQGGGATAHQKLMVRLACRFAPGPLTSSFEDLLLTFIMADQKSRSDLAILWVYETYAQFQGFTQLATAAEEQDRYDRYGRCLCRLLETLFERGEHKETLFHKILLEAPHITPDALLCLKRACLDKVYGAFGMTTLREMILTRPRQRSELLCVLLDFSYYERPDLKTQSLETAKELFQLDWIRPDVKEFVGTLLENVLRPQPPPVLFGEEQGRPVRMMVWDEHTIRACLYLYLNLLPLDHSLIQKLAEVYALANTEVKKVIFRVLEAPVKAMGMHSEALLLLLDNCPKGAETLAARIVHLLTERNAPTKELVIRLKNLHNSRGTDVRSLIPVLTGLDKAEILKALPKFVLSAGMQRSVQGVFNRLLTGKNIETGAPPMSAQELMVELHKIEPKTNDEMKYLISAMGLLFSQSNTYTKDVLAGVIQTLLDLDPMPTLMMRTILQALTLYPVLNGFIMNVLHRLIGKQVWTQPKLWEGFVKCCQKTIPQCFQVLLHLPPVQLRALFLASLAQGEDIRRPLIEHVRSLPGHQQAHVPAEILRTIMEDPTTAATKVEAEVDETALEEEAERQMVEDEDEEEEAKEELLLEEDDNDDADTPQAAGEVEQRRPDSPESGDSPVEDI